MKRNIAILALACLLSGALCIVINTISHGEDLKQLGIGRDTVFYMKGGKYQIVKSAGHKTLLMKKDDTYETLLNDILKYKYHKGDLYLVDEDGYAIAYGDTEKCKIFIVNPDEFIWGYSFDDKGVQHPYFRFISDEDITYRFI